MAFHNYSNGLARVLTSLLPLYLHTRQLSVIPYTGSSHTVQIRLLIGPDSRKHLQHMETSGKINVPSSLLNILSLSLSNTDTRPKGQEEHCCATVCVCERTRVCMREKVCDKQSMKTVKNTRSFISTPSLSQKQQSPSTWSSGLDWAELCPNILKPDRFTHPKYPSAAPQPVYWGKHPGIERCW